MNPAEKIVFEPIGYVKTAAVGDEVKDRTNRAQIILKSEYVEALSGITEFSHIYVLFFLNQVTPQQRKTQKVYPRGRRDMPLTGIFATRTMMRPNPIGITVVELQKVEGTTLTVKGLDAYDGTPVLDIKPYDTWDDLQNVRVAGWWKKLAEENLK
ncbi:MAG: tRNA (N6-threonylcarbamoyladenosine(37)-N6)-methyltransferase TrmO [Candidatus Bathyarchaeota archaeon]|nr:tRNA (N6-threonylcarbamoyladenosine(37)-N6)-methyltransferase TrmO [Candidatus Bathyarchaeota archaeon]